MQRRKFIKNTSVAALAVSLPVSKVFSKPYTCDVANFSSVKEINAGTSYSFDITMCPSAIYDFQKTAEEDRKLELIIATSRAEDGAILSYTANYKISAVQQSESDSNFYSVTANREEETGKTITPPSEVDFNKLKFGFTFSATEANFITLKDKKNADYLKLPMEAEPAPEDCFLTTACVQTLGKPDNCFELATLRSFRDTVLVNMEGGKEMVKEYYLIAPGIVANINARRNKKNIYLGIYNQMILPVIENIGKNNYSRAVEIYKNYTLALKTKFS